MNTLEAIIKEIDDKVDQLRNHLATGNVETLEEYKKLCGEIKGLLYVRGYTLDIQKANEYGDS